MIVWLSFGEALKMERFGSNAMSAIAANVLNAPKPLESNWDAHEAVTELDSLSTRPTWESQLIWGHGKPRVYEPLKYFAI